MKIRDHVHVRVQPTVVRLDHLQENESGWITDNYYITEAVQNHLKTLETLFQRREGRGIFLIGHYGSGKSHFLAFLSRQAAAGAIGGLKPMVCPVSLLNFSADQSLESIVVRSLPLEGDSPDRRDAWRALAERNPQGVLLVLDELSEFLRAKPDQRSFNEDIRFLQFMGEWSQEQPLWIMAALQEQIEHTGEMEFDLFRKIKDRYPIRLILTPTHVKDLIAKRILVKEEGYGQAVTKLVGQLEAAFPESPVDFADLMEIYPIHPATLTLLEEVRDRFSQARGIVGFTMAQLGGDQARGIEPFLDMNWGNLLGPDTIVDHFADLFEVQPEFLPLAQKVLPYYRKHMERIFPKPAQRVLAQRLLKLLILAHLSPAREGLDVKEAAWWLLYKVSTIDPQKNFTVIARILDALAEHGAFINRTAGRYRIDLKEDSRETLDVLLNRTLAEMDGQDVVLLESLTPTMQGASFDPFQLDRGRWRKHNLRWHFHDRELNVFFGDEAPTKPDGVALQIGLPWGPQPQAIGCFKLLPKTIELTGELRELAALLRLEQSPHPKAVLKAVRERIPSRAALFQAQVRDAYQQAELWNPGGERIRVIGETNGRLNEWVMRLGHQIFRHVFPQFEDYAPSSGPLPQEAYRKFMDQALHGDLCSEDPHDFVKLIREAYLVPMKLMDRKGRAYRISPKLDKHDLVNLIRPLLDHQPGPKRIYQHLATPVYGLVADQVHLLLLLLMVQGEIEIQKGRNSLRDLYETLPTPIHYDRILPGKHLKPNQLLDLTILCEGLGISFNKGANVLAQRRCAQQLRKFAHKERDALSGFLANLRDLGEAEELCEKIEAHLGIWAALDKGENELQGVQHFLFQVGAPGRFLDTWRELSQLPRKFESLIKETRRCRHLLAHPALAHCPDSEIQVTVAHLAEPPDLSETDALEEWLESVRLIYHRYRGWYTKTHDQAWLIVKQNPNLNYAPPAIARGRHLGQGAALEELSGLQRTIQNGMCRGLTNLEFQPVCMCGFNGVDPPLAAELERLNALKDEIETGLTEFFAQEKVKNQVRQWQEKGMETEPGMLAYLEDSKPWPEVKDLALFDSHLAGIELFREVNPNEVLNLLTERVWERSGLQRALEQLLTRWGPRISFGKTQPAGSQKLLAWSLETALKTGTPLPEGLSTAEQETMAELVKPQHVNRKTLKNLEKLGLGRKAEDRILELVLTGKIEGRPDKPRGVLAAACCYLDRTLPEGPEDLARTSALLYRHHARISALAGPYWTAYVHKLNETRIPETTPALMDALDRDRQWLVFDCFGLPLLPLIQTHIEEWLPHWTLAEITYAQVGYKTDTAAFYDALAEARPGKPFYKIDAVDELIHQADNRFEDLEKRAAAELAVACRNLKHLDPSQGIAVFADHGFRLTPEGTGFSHGGPGALEKLVPLINLNPRG
ncbi:MAG: DUF6079 family protein [Acidobacteriota bacterium]|nr:DUF6079 family protein [Acidobacteriota bacterium]